MFCVAVRSRHGITCSGGDLEKALAAEVVWLPMPFLPNAMIDDICAARVAHFDRAAGCCRERFPVRGGRSPSG
jgi:hypothetical protein